MTAYCKNSAHVYVDNFIVNIFKKSRSLSVSKISAESSIKYLKKVRSVFLSVYFFFFYVLTEVTQSAQVKYF